MKRVFALLLCFSLCSLSAFAQQEDEADESEVKESSGFRIPTHVGNYMVGANLLLANAQFQKGTETNYNLGLSPKLGVFVLPNIALGFSIDAGISGHKTFRSVSYGVTPFTRIYFAHDNAARRRPLQAFAEAGVGFGGVNTRIESGSSTTTLTTNGIRFYLMPGVDYFLNNHVAAEAGLQYTFTGGSPDAHVLGLSLGFQIFLGR